MVSAKRVTAVVAGLLFLAVGLLLTLASAPYFFLTLGWVSFLPWFFPTFSIISSFASSLLSHLSFLFVFSLTTADATPTFAVGIGMALTGGLLITRRWASLAFGVIFLLIGAPSLLSAVLNASTGYTTASNFDFWVHEFYVGSIMLATGLILLAVWKWRNVGPGTYYSAVKIKTEPELADIEGIDGIAWGTTGDSKNRDYPYVRHLLSVKAPNSLSREESFKALKRGHYDVTHTWMADYKWKNKHDARKNEVTLTIQLKSTYGN